MRRYFLLSISVEAQKGTDDGERGGKWLYRNSVFLGLRARSSSIPAASWELILMLSSSRTQVVERLALLPFSEVSSSSMAVLSGHKEQGARDRAIER